MPEITDEPRVHQVPGLHRGRLFALPGIRRDEWVGPLPVYRFVEDHDGQRGEVLERLEIDPEWERIPTQSQWRADDELREPLLAGGWTHEAINVTPTFVLADWLRDRGHEALADMSLAPGYKRLIHVTGCSRIAVPN